MALTKLNARSATALDATILTGNLPAINGSALTNLTAGKILQVVSATYATEVSSTDSSSWTDTGLSLAITPSATSSKVLFIISQNAFVTRSSSLARGLYRVLRGSTTVYDSANWSINMQQSGTDLSHSTMLVFSGLDSPSSTSALTYKSQMLPESSTTMKSQQSNHPSTITLLEVGA